MLYRFFSRVWLALPWFVRRFFIRLSHGTFTVSAAAVVLNAERKVLVLRHLLRPDDGWGLPGGFIDAREQPADAIRRELMEETGIELEELRLLRVRTIGRHIEMLFAARSNDDARIMSQEIAELGWYTFEELPDQLPKDQLGVAQAVLKGEI
jgi:ADP-ribose pyrophosphatase YjhB (NUDIX family)